MDSESLDLDTIQSNIKQILLQNGWDQSLLVETLESRYKTNHQRDLSTDCWQFRRCSVEDFLVRSEIFRLFLKSGKTHVYLHPEKLEQPLPPTVPPASAAKRFKRKKKRQRRGDEVTVIKFKANPWGSFEPIDETQTPVESQELKPRPPAFDLYSDHESDTDDCELVPVQSEILPPLAVLPSDDYPTTIPSFNVEHPVQQSTPESVQRPFLSSQQIDGPTAQDFHEEESEPEPPPTIFGLQDLSLYALRQEECNRFSYNDLPKFRQCINFNAPRY